MLIVSLFVHVSNRKQWYVHFHNANIYRFIMIYLYIPLHTDSIWTSRTFACPIMYPSLSGGFNSAQRSWLPPVGGRDGLCLIPFFWFYRNPYFIAGFLKGNCCKFVSKKASEVDELVRSFTDVGHQQVPRCRPE